MLAMRRGEKEDFLIIDITIDEESALNTIEKKMITSRGECAEQIKEAIEFHLEGLREEGLPIPEPTTLCEYVEAR